VGWYFGYTRPSVTNQRELLKKYQLEKDNFHVTDADMADFAAHKKEYFEGMKREDEMAAAMAFAALLRLERDDIAKARNVLERTISIYFRGHRHDGDSNILRNIEIFAATNASLSNAIYRKLE
jgi:hypothetical protein